LKKNGVSAKLLILNKSSPKKYKAVIKNISVLDINTLKKIEKIELNMEKQNKRQNKIG